MSQENEEHPYESLIQSYINERYIAPVPPSGGGRKGKGKTYDTDPGHEGSYDTYMTFFRSFGIYVPRKWEIDADMTQKYWKQESKGTHTWKWRKVILRAVGGEAQAKTFGYTLPFYGGFVYAAGERRGWFIKKHMAFWETVNQEIRKKIDAALRVKPYDKDEDFAPLKVGGVSEQAMERWGKAARGQAVNFWERTHEIGDNFVKNMPTYRNNKLNFRSGSISHASDVVAKFFGHNKKKKKKRKKRNWWEF